MKKKFIFSFVIQFIFFFQFITAQNLDQLREEYLHALHDYEFAPAVYQSILQVEKPSAKTLAYRGALEAIMTKTCWNIFKKISYLNKSEDSFEEAVKKDPNDIEIRLMRMAVQYEIPSYLGYSNDIDNDKAFIMSHIDTFNPNDFPENIIEEIVGFIYKCNKFTSAQILKIQSILALKLIPHEN